MKTNKQKMKDVYYIENMIMMDETYSPLIMVDETYTMKNSYKGSGKHCRVLMSLLLTIIIWKLVKGS